MEIEPLFLFSLIWAGHTFWTIIFYKMLVLKAHYIRLDSVQTIKYLDVTFQINLISVVALKEHQLRKQIMEENIPWQIALSQYKFSEAVDPR